MPEVSRNSGNRLALVMTGGGARAAYQVGVLRALAKLKPDLAVPILTGVSAGAINAGYLANHRGPFAESVRDISAVWEDVSIDMVFEVGSESLVRNVFRWGGRLFMGGHKNVQVRGMVDTSPLRHFLQHHFPAFDSELLGVDYNLRSGRLDALAITAVNYTTGRSTIWIQTRDIDAWKQSAVTCIRTDVDVEHIMASSALPVFFPSVKVGADWFGDGGIGETAPLSPAIRLKADKILAISTRHRSNDFPSEERLIEGYPPPAQVVGVLMSVIFVDALDRDARSVLRYNRLLSSMGVRESNGIRRVDLMVMRPSVDISKLAARYESELKGPFGFLTKGLGTEETERPDWLSMILFEQPYIKHLLEIGEEDGFARADELLAFLEDSTERLI